MMFSQKHKSIIKNEIYKFEKRIVPVHLNSKFLLIRHSYLRPERKNTFKLFLNFISILSDQLSRNVL